MRLDINTLEPEFTPEEWKIIKDYLKFVKGKLKYPDKPEIVIGGARYPFGRMVIRKGLLQPFKRKVEVTLEQRPEKKDKLNPLLESLSNIQTILEDLKLKGKSKDSTKRKKYESKDNSK